MKKGLDSGEAVGVSWTEMDSGRLRRGGGTGGGLLWCNDFDRNTPRVCAPGLGYVGEVGVGGMYPAFESGLVGLRSG